MVSLSAHRELLQLIEFAVLIFKKYYMFKGERCGGMPFFLFFLFPLPLKIYIFSSMEYGVCD